MGSYTTHDQITAARSEGFAISRLQLVTVNEAYLLAEQVANSLDSIAGHLSECGHTESAEALHNAGREIRSRPSTAQPRGRDPTHGYRTKYPLWSLLIPPAGQTGTRQLDTVRAMVVLHALSDDDLTYAKKKATELRYTLETLESNPAQEAIDAVDRLRQSALQWLEDSSKPSDASQALGTLVDLGLIPTSIASAFRSLFAISAGLPAPPTEHELVSGEKNSRPRRPSVGSANVQTAVLRRPQTYVSGDDEPPPDEVTLIDRELVEAGPNYRAIELGRVQHLVATQLDTGSDLALTAAEGRTIATWLYDAAEAALSRGDIVAAEACVVWLVVLVTTRDLDQVMAEPAKDSQGDVLEKALFTAGFANWRTHLPRDVSFWSPPAPLDTEWAAQVARLESSVVLPTPDRLRELLFRLESLGGRRPRLFQTSPSLLADRCRNLRAELRAGPAPRFSETRLRLALPIEVVTKTGEICLAQILAGQRFALSDAPLHYYAAPVSTLEGVYRDSLGRYVSEAPKAAPPSLENSFIGAPIALTPDHWYRAFVDHLREDIVRSATKTSFRDRLRTKVNAIVRYTAWMLCAAAAHRVTHWLSELTLGHIHPDGWAVIQDKETEAIGALRVVVLPPQVIEQLEVLRLALKELADRLRESESLSDHEAEKNLDARVNGTAPLFCWVSSRHEIEPLNTGLLREYWLREHRLPGNFLRARTRMAMTRAGIHPQWIYWQLGHTYLGRGAFSLECPYSLTQFAQLMSPVLQQALASDGWTVAPVVLARRPKLPWPVCGQLGQSFQAEVDREIATLREDWLSRRQLPYTDKAFTLPSDMLNVRNEWVARAMQQLGPQSTQATHPVHEVSPSILEQVVDELLESELGEHLVDAILRRLRTDLGIRYKRLEWRGSLPPQLRRTAFCMPAITRTHLAAHRLARKLRNWALTPSPTGNADQDELLAQLAIMIATEGQVGTTQALLAALQPATVRAAMPLPEAPDRSIVEWSEAENGARPRARVLSKESSAIARRLSQRMQARTEVIEISAADVDGALRKFLPKDLCVARKKSLLGSLVELGKLSANVDLPGMVATRLTAIDAKTLGAARSVAWLQNSLTPGEVPVSIATPAHLPDQAQPAQPAQKRQVLLDSFQQYRALTTAWSRLIESGRTVGVDHYRFTKARQLIDELLVDPSLGSNVRLIARFASSLLVPGRKLRLSTAYNYLTAIGARLLHVAGNRALPELDEEALEEIYAHLIDPRTAHANTALLGDIAIQLLAFHEVNTAFLADADLTALWQTAAGKSSQSGRVEILTSAEFVATQEVLQALPTRGLLSASDANHLGSIVDRGYYLGCRTGEAVHHRIRDSFVAEGRHFLRTQTSAVGVLKTKHSRRVHDLTALFPADSLDRHITLVSSREKATSDYNEPLIGWIDRRKVSALLNLERRCLHLVSAGEVTSNYALRHSRGSEGLLSNLIEASHASDLSTAVWPYQVSRLLGHSRPSVAIEHYWHLGHLGHAETWMSELSTAMLSAVSGISGAGIRQRRRRSISIGGDLPDYRNAQVPVVSTISTDELDRHLDAASGITVKSVAQVLMRLRLEEPVSDVIFDSVTHSQLLKAIIEVCAELSTDKIVRLVPAAQLQELARLAGVPLPSKKHPGVLRSAQLSGLVARGLVSVDVGWAEHWKEPDLKIGIAAAVTSQDDHDDRHRSQLERIPATIRSSRALPFILAAQLISMRISHR